jgi:hypothetical protein
MLAYGPCLAFDARLKEANRMPLKKAMAGRELFVYTRIALMICLDMISEPWATFKEKPRSMKNPATQIACCRIENVCKTIVAFKTGSGNQIATTLSMRRNP